MSWQVYIIKCRDKTLYTGITNNLFRRINDHNNGKGSKYTKYRRPVKLIYFEKHPTKSKALKREAYIKGLRRIEKLNLTKTYSPFTI